jgi:hypothetical protein
MEEVNVPSQEKLAKMDPSARDAILKAFEDKRIAEEKAKAALEHARTLLVNAGVAREASGEESASEQVSSTGSEEEGEKKREKEGARPVSIAFRPLPKAIVEEGVLGKKDVDSMAEVVKEKFKAFTGGSVGEAISLWSEVCWAAQQGLSEARLLVVVNGLDSKRALFGGARTPFTSAEGSMQGSRLQQTQQRYAVVYPAVSVTEAPAKGN